jgi:DNA mismatch repair protein MutS
VVFRSILSPAGDDPAAAGEPETPDYFADLRLDQVVAAITAGREEYRLLPFFNASVGAVASVTYRQEVFQDLGNAALLGAIKTFAQRMRKVRGDLDRTTHAHYRYEKERWILDAAAAYGDAVSQLTDAVAQAGPSSAGFLALRDYLAVHTASASFVTFRADTERVRAGLEDVKYRLQISGLRIRVSPFEPEPDYSAEVLRSFEKFKHGEPKEYRFDLASWPEMNHVEAGILERVAWLYPDTFQALDSYCEGHAKFLDDTIARFDREIQFYLAFLDYQQRFEHAGLSFCYAEVTDSTGHVEASGVFDLALAQLLVEEETAVVTNDFFLDEPERILVVSGPNQGGKTTFARTIGQLHHLARIGCPVPGTEARLFLVDRIFTHFEREEEVESLTGKLEEDLRRIREIVEQATPKSLVVMNESFSSTTVDDALFLNRQVLRRLIERGPVCIAVTFLDELASLGEMTVSMVSGVDPEDPVRRTFKIVRRPADGLAYAAAIAEKYRLTYKGVKRRVMASASP